MRLPFRAWWFGFLALIGCAGKPPFVVVTVMGVPNLAQVAPRLWRSGQPPDARAWAYLARRLDAPRVTVVKLNDDTEAGLDAPLPAGWTLIKHAIPPEDDKPWTVAILPKPEAINAIVEDIVAAYMRGDTVLWHCTAGRDRTSLISALVGMRLLGWSKDAAWQDMLAHGFRWELPDLDLYWLRDVR